MAMTRTETGPLKIGDDWTGYFIRGDEACGMSDVMSALANGLEDGTVPPHRVAEWLRRKAEDLARVVEAEFS